MTHKRTDIKNRWKTLVSAALPTVPVEVSRGYAVSAFPHINIKSGGYASDFEANTRAGKPREYDVILEVTAEDDEIIDDFIEVFEALVEANMRNDLWNSCQFFAADEPEDTPGEKPYTTCMVHIYVTFEV